MRHAWIVSIGTELALGQTVDTNTAWLAEQLAALGIRPSRHVTVADDTDATRDVLLQAADACDVILVTGGLGPTADDLTRHALADAAGVPLELHEPSVEHIRARFVARGREMSSSNVVQAMIPSTGHAIHNTRGTAPGVQIELRGTPCYAMPGVPPEMRTMFERDIAPQLRQAAGGAIVLSRRLHTFGEGESVIGERIANLMTLGRNPHVGTSADLGVITIRINATADKPADARTLADETEHEIRERLGELVYGRDDETLESVIGNALRAAGRTLATAESCTGGMIGALLTDVPGSSDYYVGGTITYANSAKSGLAGVAPADIEQHGAVSDVVARAMASGVAQALGADYALSVTGIAGPSGGTAEKPVGLAFIGVHSPAGTVVHECRFGHDSARLTIRTRAARTALNLLRLELLRTQQG